MNLYAKKKAMMDYTWAILRRLFPPDGETGEVTIEKLIWLFVSVGIILLVSALVIHYVFPHVEDQIKKVLEGNGS